MNTNLTNTVNPQVKSLLDLPVQLQVSVGQLGAALDTGGAADKLAIKSTRLCLETIGEELDEISAGDAGLHHE